MILTLHIPVCIFVFGGKSGGRRVNHHLRHNIWREDNMWFTGKPLSPPNIWREDMWLTGKPLSLGGIVRTHGGRRSPSGFLRYLITHQTDLYQT